MLWELMKWSLNGQSFDLQTISLNQLFKETYGDQWPNSEARQRQKMFFFFFFTVSYLHKA